MCELITRSKFKALLKHGHGRAALYIRLHGLASFADIVGEVVLYESVYDRQFENGRAAWLVGLIVGTEQYPVIAGAILDALAGSADVEELDFLCELAAEMAKAGDHGAAVSLRRRVLQQELGPASTQFGCKALVALDGVDAIVTLARRYGDHLIEHPDAATILLGDLDGDPAIISNAAYWLRQMAPADVSIATFLIYSDIQAASISTAPAMTAEERRERRRRDFPLVTLLAQATAGLRGMPHRYAAFGKEATASELETVFDVLMEAKDEKTILRLLWVFRRAAIPDIITTILDFTQSTNNHIRRAAFVALGQLSDDRVGRIGRDALQQNDFHNSDAEIMGLFIKNFLPGDEALILAFLPKFSTAPDVAHALGEALIDIAEENRAPSTASLLDWVYENTPCGHCRNRAVNALIDIADLSAERVLECEYDGNDDVRKTIANYKAR